MSEPRKVGIVEYVNLEHDDKELLRAIHQSMNYYRMNREMATDRDSYKEADGALRWQKHRLEDLLFRARTGIEAELEIPF